MSVRVATLCGSAQPERPARAAGRAGGQCRQDRGSSAPSGRRTGLSAGKNRAGDKPALETPACPFPALRKLLRASPCSISPACGRDRPACANWPTGAPTSSRSKRRRASEEPMGGPREGPRLSEPAPQQAQHDAQPEVAGGARRLQAHGQEGRRRGGEFPPRREEAARHRLQDARQDQSASRLCQHFGLRPGRTLCRPARLRSDRAGHGRADVDYRPAGPGAGARRHPDRRSYRRTVRGARHSGRAAGTREIAARASISRPRCCKRRFSCSTFRPRVIW